MKPLADVFEPEPEPAEPWFPMCGQGPDRGAAEPEPGCGLAVECAELAGALPADVAADVELDEFPLAPAELAEPPEVAAAATPAPAASPATATAPPIASLRSVPTDLSPDMNALLRCVCGGSSLDRRSGQRHRLTSRAAAARLSGSSQLRPGS
jgi:hypothetical protein